MRAWRRRGASSAIGESRPGRGAHPSPGRPRRRQAALGWPPPVLCVLPQWRPPDVLRCQRRRSRRRPSASAARMFGAEGAHSAAAGRRSGHAFADDASTDTSTGIGPRASRTCTEEPTAEARQGARANVRGGGGGGGNSAMAKNGRLVKRALVRHAGCGRNVWLAASKVDPHAVSPWGLPTNFHNGWSRPCARPRLAAILTPHAGGVAGVGVGQYKAERRDRDTHKHTQKERKWRGVLSVRAAWQASRGLMRH